MATAEVVEVTAVKKNNGENQEQEEVTNSQSDKEVVNSSENGVVEKTGGKESGVRRRIKINIPGIITTDKSSKKPPDYGWAQQRLPACRPVYTGLHVFIVFLFFGIIFIILGSVFLALNLQLHEYSTTYTNCNSRFPNQSEANTMNCILMGDENDFATCAEYVSNISSYNRTEKLRACPCYCQVTLNVERDMSPPVHVYYQLTNYYQNHRRYVYSWSPRSLRADDIKSSRSDCNPLESSDGKPIFPCGLVANSFFNDTLWLNGIDINQTNIAWKTDRDTRFKNPPSDLNPFNTSLINTTGTILPPNWLKLIDHGQRNESFIVWFRTAAFPNFRKLYGRINPPNGQQFPSGNYTLNVVYNYPVTAFNGGKQFVVSEVSWLGTRNLFLGILYLITGGLLILVGVVLLIVHFTCSKWKLSNSNFLDREY